jgi:hydroxyethylthiazole kinase-like uncharacterized protein yjeF
VLSERSFVSLQPLFKKVNVVVMGPGLTNARGAVALIRKVLLTCRVPAVIDADGLQALVQPRSVGMVPGGKIIPWVLTPHTGEMARLIKKSVAWIEQHRSEVARDFAMKYRIVLVLKGHRTVVADPQGNVYVNKTGNPGMATAGSGDVLSGIIGAFIGQGLPLFEAARLGVYLHGKAGDWGANEKSQISLIASDIIDMLPKVMRHNR